MPRLIEIPQTLPIYGAVEVQVPLTSVSGGRNGILGVAFVRIPKRRRVGWLRGSDDCGFSDVFIFKEVEFQGP